MTNVIAMMNRTTQHRYGALSDAVVDLYMCVRAERFKGSKHSSFSETIEVMRGLR